MALATWADYQAEIAAPGEIVHMTKNALTSPQGRWMSLWASAPLAGAAPTTAAVPDRTTAGALGQQNAGAGNLRLARVAGYSQAGAALLLVDRLSHQGGLDATVTTPQTTNLPTAALTRTTSGAGVFAALEIYTQIGATGTTVTASYTNQAGTAGQVTPAIDFGAAGNREAGRLIWLPLAAGDTGVKSVESVTVLASTLTAGNFGVTLVRPLAMFWVPLTANPVTDLDAILGMNSQFPIIEDGACLQFCFLGTAVNGVLVASLCFIEE